MRFQGRLSAECPFLLSSDCKLIIRDKLQLIECFVTSRSPQGKKLSKLCKSFSRNCLCDAKSPQRNDEQNKVISHAACGCLQDEFRSLRCSNIECENFSSVQLITEMSSDGFEV